MKTVVIVGGSSGIGLALASKLYTEGYQVVIGSRSLEKLKKAQNIIGQGTVALKVDMTDPLSIDGFMAHIGKIDHLVITGSEAVGGNFVDADMRAQKRFFESKFWGPYQFIQKSFSKMASDGSITLFSGAAGQRASPGFACGSAINAAIESLVRSLAVELAPIRVNCISPGIVDTPAWDAMMSSEAKNNFYREMSGKLPVRRIGKPEDLTGMVITVINGGYITGSTLLVDGGYLLIN